MEADYGETHFEAVDLVQFTREGVYTPDGVDLLHVRQVLGFTATLAPGGQPVMVSATKISPDVRDTLNGIDGTSVALKANPRGEDPTDEAFPRRPALETGVTPVNQWQSGPETDAELRDRLMVPRQRLILWAFERQTGKKMRWLESPRPGFDVDATHGPIPMSCDIVSASGEPNSVGVFFQISTCTTPCPTGADRLVLAHRWEMTHEPDEDFYLNRVIRGEITFHGGAIKVAGVRPDLIGPQFMHPIPLGFRRLPPALTQSSDGLTIRYVITDVDPTITFSPGDSGASQIAIFEKHQMFVPDAAYTKRVRAQPEVRVFRAGPWGGHG